MYSILLPLVLLTVTFAASPTVSSLSRSQNNDDYITTKSTAVVISTEVSSEELKDKMEYRTSSTKQRLVYQFKISNTQVKSQQSEHSLLKPTGRYESFTQADINKDNQDIHHNKFVSAGVDEKQKVFGKEPEHSVHKREHPFQGSEDVKLKNLTQQQGTDQKKIEYFWNENENKEIGFTAQSDDLTSNTRNNKLKQIFRKSRLYRKNLRHFLSKRAVTNNAKMVRTNDKFHIEHLNDIPDKVTGKQVLRRQKYTKQHQEKMQIRGQKSLPTCKIKVVHKSRTYFQSQLISREPDFVQFRLSFCKNTTIRPLFTNDVFQGKRWFWTYNSTSGPYPFLSWDLDYGILSFHLLEARTINVPYVCIKLQLGQRSANCSFTFGEQSTTQSIVSALVPIVNITESDEYVKYPASYFCHLSTRQYVFGTLHYWAAIYFNYPINFIYYKCCTVSLNYDNDTFVTECQEKSKNISGFHTWRVTKLLPYGLCFLLLLYFPVMFFSMDAWLAKDEKFNNDVFTFEMAEDLECLDYMNESWQFADGNSPLTLGELLSFKTLGLVKHPVLVSRLRRLLFILSFPVFIYLQIAMYSEGMGLWDMNKLRVKDLVKVGCPMGFLSILGDAEDRRRVFVPLLGGPVGVVTIYFILSVLFIALPRSVKHVVEDGLPSTNLIVNSPLFFGTKEVISMSMINVKPYHLIPGYTKAVTLMKCRFYMLFTGAFWSALWNIQTERITGFIGLTNTRRCTGIIIIGIVLPIYVLLCAVEMACCIIFHGIPFGSFLSIMINGGIKSFGYLRGQSMLLSAIFKYRITALIGGSSVILLFMIYIYVISLAFIVSFGFIFEVITFCFVAIIIYPSVSFGYLFFFIVLLYYFITLVKNFGEGYMELLGTTVDMSRRLFEGEGNVTVNNDELSVSNVRVENIADVRINGKLLNVCPNILKSLKTDRSVIKIKERDSTYGIPKTLFDFVVSEHRPVHQQVLILFFKAAIMITFVILTLTISANYVTGPTTEISEVMHVIFIVAVGAVPQLVQAVLSRSDTVLAREIEEREIKKTIVEFWKREAELLRLSAIRGSEYYQSC